eukprot:334802-Heterocapsa_arctica.AAC.1
MMNPTSQGFYEVPGDPANRAPPFEIPGQASTHPNMAGTAGTPQVDPWMRPWSSAASGSATSRPPPRAMAGLLAAVVGAGNLGLGNAVQVRTNISRDSPTGWIRNLTQDGDIEHQPGPGKWFNAHNFPGLYYKGKLKHR